MLHIKRIYDKPDAGDGYRILVDRLWPRGVSKERAAVDTWLKEVAPSPELRTWFDHDPDKFREFSERYTAELAHNAAVKEIAALIKQHRVTTLLYGAKDPAVNHAVVLRDFLQKHKG